MYFYMNALKSRIHKTTALGTDTITVAKARWSLKWGFLHNRANGENVRFSFFRHLRGVIVTAYHWALISSCDKHGTQMLWYSLEISMHECTANIFIQRDLNYKSECNKTNKLNWEYKLLAFPMLSLGWKRISNHKAKYSKSFIHCLKPVPIREIAFESIGVHK